MSNIKSNINQFICSLTYIDIRYLENHIGNSHERKQAINAIKNNFASQNHSQSFKYQNLGINRKSMSRLKHYAEDLFHQNNWENKLAELKSFAVKLINKKESNIDSDLAEAILRFFERDIKLCELSGGYCMHTCITPKYVLNFLLVELRHASDYNKFLRAIEIENYYMPYFKEYEKYIIYYNRLRLKYKDKKWEMIPEDIKEIKRIFDIPGQCLINKLNLLSYLSIYNLFQKNHTDQKELMDKMVDELVKNPYRNIGLITMLHRSFFDCYMHLNQVEKASKFYIDLNKIKFTGQISKYNKVYHLSTKLNVYDLIRAGQFIPKHTEFVPAQEEPFLLPYFGRYYYLNNRLNLAQIYIQTALRRINNINSSMYFIETYSTFFGILFYKKKYDNIIRIYEGLNFKLKHINSQQLGNYNFEIRFFYLLSKFKLGALTLNNLFKRIYYLIDYKSGKNDIYDKLKIINNLKKMNESIIPLEQPLKDLYEKMEEEIRPMLKVIS